MLPYLDYPKSAQQMDLEASQYQLATASLTATEHTAISIRTELSVSRNSKMIAKAHMRGL